ncbi:MAG: TIGR00266 family protein [Candidatus Micrarchaeota archaeon]|nr:TIGR00266 family protein [Candidatus Micrarchaeota archaeon]
MKVEVRKTSLGNILEAKMVKGDCIYAEPGAIISSSGEIEISSELAGGLASSALRMIGGGESVFINKVTAQQNAVLQLGTAIPSEIAEVPLDGGMILGDGVYLAHTGDIKISSKFGGLTALSAGAGFMFLHASGKGTLYIAGGEALLKKVLKKGEQFFVDNACFVGVEDSAQIDKFIAGKNLMSKLAGGEGIMLKITGPATVYYQTESPASLASYLAKYAKG